MGLDGDGMAPPELSEFPAGCAPSVRSFGTPALAPGIDWPNVAPLVDEPVVVVAAEVPAVDPLLDDYSVQTHPRSLEPLL
jgi:hypothetical protein